MAKSKNFSLSLNYEKNISLMARKEYKFCIWPKRLGHLNYNNLTLLSQKNMVFGLPIVEKKHKVCERCLLRKHHQQPFPKEGVKRANEVLNLVHTNVCGPIHTLSHA